MSNPVLGTSEFTLETRRVALAGGANPNHPRLNSDLSRKVFAMIVSGLVPAERIRGRWYIDPAHARRTAEILGLVPTEEDCGLTTWRTIKNPPATANG